MSYLHLLVCLILSLRGDGLHHPHFMNEKPEALRTGQLAQDAQYKQDLKKDLPEPKSCVRKIS
jgi:hypothetical protein